MAEPTKAGGTPAKRKPIRRVTGPQPPAPTPETYIGTPFGVPLFGVLGIEG